MGGTRRREAGAGGVLCCGAGAGPQGLRGLGRPGLHPRDGVGPRMGVQSRGRAVSRPEPLPLAACGARFHFLAPQPQSELFGFERRLRAGIYLLPPSRAPWVFQNSSSWFLTHLQPSGKTKFHLKKKSTGNCLQTIYCLSICRA